jgi:hypothetical protein
LFLGEDRPNGSTPDRRRQAASGAPFTSARDSA